MARLTKLSLPMISRVIGELMREDIVWIDTQRKQYLVYGNFDNPNFIFNKKIANIDSLWSLVEYLKLRFEAGVLFDSYMEGTDTENSDIDIFLKGKQKRLDLNEFENKLNRNINYIISEKLDNNIKNIVFNGMKLWGWINETI